MIKLHQYLPANTTGRDFIVGDLHGCLDLFQVALDRIAFDPGRDRVLSVGDLADRGPDSMGCLRLLREPWWPGLSLTYVGHSPLNQMRLHASHFFVDRGAYFRRSNTCLLVLRHEEVRAWLPAV